LRRTAGNCSRKLVQKDENNEVSDFTKFRELKMKIQKCCFFISLNPGKILEKILLVNTKLIQIIDEK